MDGFTACHSIACAKGAPQVIGCILLAAKRKFIGEFGLKAMLVAVPAA